MTHIYSGGNGGLETQSLSVGVRLTPTAPSSVTQNQKKLRFSFLRTLFPSGVLGNPQQVFGTECEGCSESLLISLRMLNSVPQPGHPDASRMFDDQETSFFGSWDCPIQVIDPQG